MKPALNDQLSVRIEQADFAEMVGISEARVSQMLAEGHLERGGTARQWLVTYCHRLREQAAGRDANGVLARERAALTRSQREGQEIKNAVAKKEYASIGLLADVLAVASAAVVDRFDQLPGVLRKACPDLPLEARDQVMKTIASARNEWIRSTEQLVVVRLEEMTEDEPEDDGLLDGLEGDEP